MTFEEGKDYSSYKNEVTTFDCGNIYRGDLDSRKLVKPFSTSLLDLISTSLRPLEITGNAGSGKSYFLLYILEIATSNQRQVYLVDTEGQYTNERLFDLGFKIDWAYFEINNRVMDLGDLLNYVKEIVKLRSLMQYKPIIAVDVLNMLELNRFSIIDSTDDNLKKRKNIWLQKLMEIIKLTRLNSIDLVFTTHKKVDISGSFDYDYLFDDEFMSPRNSIHFRCYSPQYDLGLDKLKKDIPLYLGRLISGQEKVVNSSCYGNTCCNASARLMAATAIKLGLSVHYFNGYDRSDVDFIELGIDLSEGYSVFSYYSNDLSDVFKLNLSSLDDSNNIIIIDGAEYFFPNSRQERLDFIDWTKTLKAPLFYYSKQKKLNMTNSDINI